MTQSEAKMRILAEWRTWVGHRQATDTHTSAETSVFFGVYTTPLALKIKTTRVAMPLTKPTMILARSAICHTRLLIFFSFWIELPTFCERINPRRKKLR